MKIKIYPLLGLSLISGLSGITGLSGCGSHSSGNTATIDQKKEIAPVPTLEQDGISIDKVRTPDLPLDLAGQPSFATQGFVIASETYGNSNNHPVKILPSQSGLSLVLQTQIRNTGGNTNAYSVTSPLTLSVTSPQGTFDIERISHSILGSEIEVGAGQEITLNWRISPASDLPLCRSYLDTQLLFQEVIPYAEGAKLTGRFQMTVSFSDDSSQTHGLLFTDDFLVDSSGGAVNTVPNILGSGNCAWVKI